MNLIVFTATLGTTDTVREPLEVDNSVRYLCFSDGPIAPAPYVTIPVVALEPPSLASRRIKILADHHALAGADALVWHDAAYRLLGTLGWARRVLRRADLVAMRHARRERIEDEALAIARYRYVTSDQALAHVGRYRAAGFTADGLTSPGLMAAHVSPAVETFRRIWWAETLKWGGRDQGSVDYAAWAARCVIAYVKGNHRGNPYAAHRQVSNAEAPA